MLSLLLTTLLLPTHLRATPASDERSDLAASVHELATAFHEKGVFDGAVLVLFDGRLLYEGGFGHANREWAVPNAPDTVFNVGSCAKPLTATLILHLVDQGLLSLDEPIGNWIPELRKDWGARITLTQLLSHTSGLPRTPLEFTADDDDDLSLERVVEILNGANLDSEPGSRFSYSNAGFNLLAKIAENVTGEPFPELMRTRIFQPLGMVDSRVGSFPSVMQRRASGYERSLHFDWLKVGHASRSRVYDGPGNLYMTMRDVVRWERALHENTLMSPELTQRMFSSNASHGYGLGWYIDRERAADGEVLTLARHSGWTGAFGTTIWRFIEREHLIIVCQNNGVVPWPLTRQITNLLLGRPQDEFPVPGVTRTLLTTLFDKGQEAALVRFNELPENTALRGYEPVMASGAPDAEPRDDPLAWASETKDGQAEWLELEYAKPIRPIAVHVYESQNPGAISRLTLSGTDAEQCATFDPLEREMHRSDRGIHVSVFPVFTDFAVARVRLELDSQGTPGWNEIDAVAVEHEFGALHWASEARASSTASVLIPLQWDATPLPADLERVARRLEDLDRFEEARTIRRFVNSLGG